MTNPSNALETKVASSFLIVYPIIISANLSNTLNLVINEEAIIKFTEMIKKSTRNNHHAAQY
jgi:hypothetical protein